MLSLLLKSKRRKEKLSLEQQDMVVGFVLWMNKHSKLVNNNTIERWIYVVFGIQVSSSYISKLMNKNGISSRVTKIVSSNQISKKTKNSCVDFLLRIWDIIDRNKLEPDQVVAIDEVTFYSNAMLTKSYVAKGR